MGGGSEDQTPTRSPVSIRKRSTSGANARKDHVAKRERRASSASERLHPRPGKLICTDAPVVHVSETHDYMRLWNPHITEGYRLCNSYKEIFLSLFYFHNCWWDTITALFNIVHSLLLFSYLSTYQLDDEDKLVFGLFFLTAWIHSLPSAAYHLIGCSGKSYVEYIFFQRLDFVFIFVSSIPLSISLSWYTFYTQPRWMIAAVSGVLVMTLLTIRVINKEMSPERRLRLIGALVFFYFIPVLYTIGSTLLSFLVGLVQPEWWEGGSDSVGGKVLVPSTWWAVAAVASLSMGAFTYGARFPECYIPNFPFSSHSWMHIGVNLAYLSEFFFILNQFWLVKRQ